MRFSTFVCKNVLRRKVRSLLTISGMALAVGAVVALLGISHGFEQAFLQHYEQRQVDLVVFRAGVTERLTSSIREESEELVGRIPGVEAVTGGLMDVISFPERDLIGVPVQGVKPDSFLFSDLEVVRGRRLKEGDGRAAMLGVVLAEDLGKDVGDTVTIELEEFEVVGVFRSFNFLENYWALTPLAELQELMDREGQVTGLQVVVERAVPDHAHLVEQVQDAIGSLNDEEGRSLRLQAMPAHDLVKSTLQIRQSHAMSWTTSAIALVIGFIGMLNTMIMSVFERTREIGILRAIGWRRRRIVSMILGESLLLGLAGAVLGSLGAVVVTRWLATFPTASGYVEGTVPPMVVGVGFLMAVVVGLAGGAYPALRGASLAPTEAIRHE